MRDEEAAKNWWKSKCNGSYFIARACEENTTQSIASDAFLAGIKHGARKGWNAARIAVGCSIEEDNECHLVPGLRFKYDTVEDWEKERDK